MGCTAEECPGLAKNASVNTHVTPDAPPFYILHGTGDTVVSTRHARTMEEALQQADVEATLVILEGYVHGDERFGNPEIMNGVLEFVRKVFSK